MLKIFILSRQVHTLIEHVHEGVASRRDYLQ